MCACDACISANQNPTTCVYQFMISGYCARLTYVVHTRQGLYHDLLRKACNYCQTYQTEWKEKCHIVRGKINALKFCMSTTYGAPLQIPF